MSAKLMDPEARARMAAVLLTRAQTRLVTRVGFEVLPRESPIGGPHRWVEIYLLTFCESGGREEGFFKVNYRSEDNPEGWHRAQFDLRPLYTIDMLSPELLSVPEQERSLISLQSQIALWELNFPPFASDLEVEVDIKDSDDVYRRTPSSGLGLMLHYARLYGWLEQVSEQMKTGPEYWASWAAETFLKRLGAFIGKRLQQWDDLFG